ncbi:hypothetical protein LCGC14_0714660 [marine sediment metagenome]|uniref:Minor tail T domain-containing protein n=1 Tax=marine sediment metagenome TaxID=412755 RepID=A0A0F9QZJ8_9ZZZZ
MTSREYAGWMEFYKLEPWGSEAEWLHTAQVLAMMANVNRDAKRRPQPYKAADFMPKFDRPARVPTAEELDKKVGAIFRAMKAGPGS